jgi:hypothetical protein
VARIDVQIRNEECGHGSCDWRLGRAVGIEVGEGYGFGTRSIRWMITG